MTYTQFQQKLLILTFANRVEIRNGYEGIRLASIDRDSFDHVFRHNEKNKSDLITFLYDYYFNYNLKTKTNADQNQING